MAQELLIAVVFFGAVMTCVVGFITIRAMHNQQYDETLRKSMGDLYEEAKKELRGD